MSFEAADEGSKGVSEQQEGCARGDIQTDAQV